MRSLAALELAGSRVVSAPITICLRRLLLVGWLLLTMSLWSHLAVAQTCLHDGDVNQDGTITPGDALLVFQHFLEIATPPLDTCQQDRANVDDPADSAITPADVLCISNVS